MTKPLRIGLIMQGGHSWLGGVHYIKNIIFALESLPEEVRSTFEVCLIVCSSSSSDLSLYNQVEDLLDKVYRLPLTFNPFTFQESYIEISSIVKRVRQKLFQKIFPSQYNPRFNAFLKDAEIDFVYPYFNQSFSQFPYKSATWIYDFQHKYLENLFSQQEIEMRDRSFALMARYASTVVLSSKAACSDFQKFFPEAAHKARVLSFRTSPAPIWYEVDSVEIQNKYCLPDRFFLVSNQFWKHKNHEIVFQALNKLQSEKIYPTVVFTGHLYDYRFPEHSDNILQTINQLNLSKQVYLLGLISRNDQIQLMRRSLAVIQPSLFEGWSTVVEDARCLGKRMALSDFPVHLEQNPPNSKFFERHSAESLAPILADWWEQRSAGPDLELEATARANNRKEVQNFGYNFLEIAKA